MSKSTASKRRPVVILVGVIIALVVIFGLGKAYLDSRAGAFARAAAHGSPAAAVADLRIAHRLDPGSASYAEQLAKEYLKTGNDTAALKALGHLSTDQAAIERSEAYLEQGSVNQATSALPDRATGPVAAQKALCQQVAVASTSSSLGLAQRLYAADLYRTTLRILSLAAPSSSKYLLKADTQLQEQPANLQQARATAKMGSGQYPANLALHQLLYSLDQQTHDGTAAHQQAVLIGELKSGKI